MFFFLSIIIHIQILRESCWIYLNNIYRIQLFWPLLLIPWSLSPLSLSWITTIDSLYLHCPLQSILKILARKFPLTWKSGQAMPVFKTLQWFPFPSEWKSSWNALSLDNMTHLLISIKQMSPFLEINHLNSDSTVL